jgi:hypothetical protein
VPGEILIVEYAEPPGVAFRGRLTIGEVNHDYRGILRYEPASDSSIYFECMPDAVCQATDDALIRSTILLMINGTTACSGTLINNTENDETPYILTAVHCLNEDLHYRRDWEYYVDKAGTIVVFFNYHKPLCGASLKATEEMSVAAATPRVIVEGKDIALLELHDTPPAHYNAYYAGWNLRFDQTPYTNLHHPQAAVKKYNYYDGRLDRISFYPTFFEPDSHLRVATWTTGSTHEGSSGSPLFDARGSLVGGLSGGYSRCTNSEYDAFFSLDQGWETAHPANQLKTYLDPRNTGARSANGWDPHAGQPFSRLNNAPYDSDYRLVATSYLAPDSGYLFGNNSRRLVEFAEEFNPRYEGELHGAYLLLPPMTAADANTIEIRIYSGETTPERLLATHTLTPQFRDYSSTDRSFHIKDKNLQSIGTENYVHFDTPIPIDGKFFIAYRLNNAPDSRFAVYNTESPTGKTNSAWINRDGAWVRASAYPLRPVPTSLAIQALVRYTGARLPAPEIRSIRYIRNLHRLVLPNATDEAGTLYIYAAGGHFIQKIPFAEGQEAVSIAPQAPGSIGIARIIRDSGTYTGKFLY